MDGFTAFPEGGPRRDAAKMEDSPPLKHKKRRSGISPGA